MYCKKEKEENSKKRINIKLKDHLNSDSISQEISEKISNNSKSTHDQKSSCTNKPVNIKLPIGFHDKVFINPNLGNLCGITSTSVSDNKITGSSELVELINDDRKLKQKEKNISLEDMKINSETDSMVISKIHNFKQKIFEYLKKLFDLIECTTNQKKLLCLKSKEIFEDFIKKVECSEIIIPKNANLKVIAGAILYAAIQLEKDIPRLINGKEIMVKLDIKQGNVYDYYHNHLRHLYPRVKKQDQIDKEINRLKNRKYTKHYFTGIKGFKKIRESISLYFFELLKEKDTETIKFVSCFKYNIINNKSLPLQLNQEEKVILQKLSNHPDFNKYFSDLVEIIKYLILSSKMHKKVGANIIISYIANALMDKNINLFQTSNSFPMTLIDIYDCLKENYDEFFPERSSIEYTTLEKEERWAADNEQAYIIGSRIQLYIIKNIYNGKYNISGKSQCPECLKAGFIINTSILRLRALQFNHIKGNKIYSYTTRTFYNLFIESRGDPYFLSNLICQMEAEKVELLCTNHHNLFHAKYNKIFRYLINYKELFSLKPISIHLIIRESVNSFYKNKKSPEFKKRVREAIIIDLKRKYIIDKVNCCVCPICNEFNTTEHLPSFHGHHFDESKKTNDTSYFFRLELSCQKIVEILKKETVGFICGNCHATIQYYNDFDVLLRIYEDSDMVSKTLDDYESALDKFKIMDTKNGTIGEPLKKSNIVNDNIIRYLFAIYDITNSGIEANAGIISDYLGVSSRAVRHFFYDRYNLLNPFINIVQNRPKTLKIYFLTDYGKKTTTLLQHFRDYYNSMQ